MDLDRAFEYILSGRGILFAGSGCSSGAINLRGLPFKRGNQLRQHFVAACKLPKECSLEDAAEQFAALNGEDRLINELQQEFTVKEISASHERIAGVPWKRIYTTNYDNILETAYGKKSLRLTPVTLSDDLRNVPKNSTLCIHLNGFVDRLTRDSVHSELKLTDGSFLTASLADSKWLSLFRQDVQLARVVVFLGYSLAYDLDIKRILFEAKDLRDKCFFVIGTSPTTSTELRASRFGEVLRVNVGDFSLALEKKQKSYSPPDHPVFFGTCVVKFDPTSETVDFSDQDVLDLLLAGDVKSKFVWAALHAGRRYFLDRHPVAESLASLQTGKRAIIVHSELGNGKTLVLEGIKCKAISQGYSVYCVNNRSDDLFSELDQVLASDDKTLLIIDGYADWLDVVEYFSTHARDTAAIVATERSSVHDVLVDRFSVAFGTPELPEISADLLSDSEIEWVSDYLDEYGLWGKNAAWSRKRKCDFLKAECGAEFHAILLKILESPNIISRFANILTTLNKRRDYYEIVTTALVLSVFNLTPRLEMYMDCWGDRIVNQTRFRRDPIIRQLLDIDRGRIKFRSRSQRASYSNVWLTLMSR